MSVAYALLGLLEREPCHGYDLKNTYDGLFRADRPLKFGQVYSTLSRLERDGRVEMVSQEAGQGPDRKQYAITNKGVATLEHWLSTPEEPDASTQSTLFVKVMLALLSDRSARAYLAAQRARHLERMRGLTQIKTTEGVDLATALIADLALFHLEADVRWMELTTQRLKALRAEVAR